MRDRREMTVGFSPPPIGSVSCCADRAADECLTHAITCTAPVYHNRIGRHRDVDSRHVHHRRRQTGLAIVGVAQVQLISAAMERVDNINAARRIIPYERAITHIIPPDFEIGNSGGNDTVHVSPITQALGYGSPCKIILNDEGPIGAGVFCLSENPHLPYGRRRDEVVSQL